MPKIFISYRRDDSSHAAGRLFECLWLHVRDARQNIFIDVDNIPVGSDFIEHLDAKVAECQVMLALIGPDWLKPDDSLQGRRRIDDPNDFVRFEIASALKRGATVAPVLLDGASMPKESELPEELKPLARRQGLHLRHESFEADTERMVRLLKLKPRLAMLLSQEGFYMLALGSLASLVGGAVVLARYSPEGFLASLADFPDVRQFLVSQMSLYIGSAVTVCGLILIALGGRRLS